MLVLAVNGVDTLSVERYAVAVADYQPKNLGAEFAKFPQAGIVAFD